MSEEFGMTTGRVGTPWWETRKITEWTYSSPIPFDEQMVKRLGLPKISVALRRKRGAGKNNKDLYVFVARCEWFSNDRLKQEIESESLDELEREANKILDDVVVSQSGIKWEDWLEIRITGSIEHEEEFHKKRFHRAAGLSSELAIHVQLLKRARLPDGRDMMLQEGWRMKEFPKPKRAGVEEERTDFYHLSRSKEDEFAYLPATPENIAALEQVAQMLKVAGDKLKSLLTQKQISSTLSNVKALPFKG